MWQKGKHIGGVDGGSPVVEVWLKRNKGVLRSSSRHWPGRRRLGAVGRRRDLAKDADGGEKWSLGAVSRWFELNGVAAPSTDEGGAIDPHRWRWAGFTTANDGEQSDGDRAESKSREHVRGGESEVGELSLCAHTRDKDGWPTWDGGGRSPSRHYALAISVSHLSGGYG
jgi:hypothetical protein